MATETDTDTAENYDSYPYDGYKTRYGYSRGYGYEDGYTDNSEQAEAAAPWVSRSKM